MMAGTITEQREALEKSIVIIKQQIHLMRKCLDVKHKKNRLMDALKHASTFLSELRTNLLTPKQYYELYILAFDGLNYLSDYLKETHLNNHLADLYELVQYAGNIIPRLYLMITVGTVYISIPNAPVKEVMKDMMDMSRGVQHPIRGLFLRYYVNQRTKDLLPTEVEGDEVAGNLEDSIQFIITNFIEMNKLWVRLQHQGHSSEREKRYQERKELQILVGANLVRLSQLEHIDKDYYKKNILPTLLEQIIQCKDVLVQEYLLDVIIQVFPDEFHLATLDEFLDATLHLHPDVSISKILFTLINRLISGKERGDLDDATAILKNLQLNTQKGEEDDDEEEEKEDIDPDSPILFDRLWKYIQDLNATDPDIPIVELSTILDSIIKLSITYYPDNFSNLDKVYGFAIEKLKDLKETPDSLQENWKILLLTPITGFTKLIDLLKIENYHEFLSLQQPNLQKHISIEIIDKLLALDNKISTQEEVSKIFQLLLFIIKPESHEKGKKKLTKSLLFGANGSGDGPSSNDVINIETVSQQEKLCKVIHLLYNRDPLVNFELFEVAKQYLSKGGFKIKYTYPTLIQNCLKLVRKLQLLQRIDLDDDDNVLKIKSIFKFISQSIQEIYQLSNSDPSLCFNLSLISAQIADQIKLCDIANEFFIESFVIYEESIIDSRLQYQSILSIIGKLHQVHNLISISPDSYDNLITKTALYGSKLLKKTDQCRGVYLASHLWWIVEEEDSDVIQPIKKDNKRVLECLQKSLRIADTCLDNAVSLELFVEILNRCLYYFIHGNEVINVKYINGLIELIQNNLKKIKQSTLAEDDEDNNNREGSAKNDDDDDDDEEEEEEVNQGKEAERHFKRTLGYIELQKSIDERFQGIVVSV